MNSPRLLGLDGGDDVAGTALEMPTSDEGDETNDEAQGRDT